MLEKIKYYFWASFRRKLLDQLQEKYRSVYRGTVLDVGGRDRGKFKKPKDRVEKWIFADIDEKHHPDIVLDVSRMPQIATESVDVVSAMEVFEYVENMDQALDECRRVLKKNGTLVFSVPFLHPIADDPVDFQRWTETKWKKELHAKKFRIEKIEKMGGAFTVIADIFFVASKSSLRAIRWMEFLFHPFLSLLSRLDKLGFFLKNTGGVWPATTGYFIVARK